MRKYKVALSQTIYWDIEVEAEDFISLRAALNSFLGWAYCAEGVIVNE